MKLSFEDKITPKQVLDLCGLEYQDRGNRLQMCCPFHHDTNPSSGFYLDTELFSCYRCEITYNIVKFYAVYKDISYADSKYSLMSEFGILPTPEIRGYNVKLLFSVRATCERRLSSLRGKLILQEHSELGEMLDRVCMAYQRGKVSEDKFERAIEFWHGKVEAL